MIPANLLAWILGKDYREPVLRTEKWFRDQMKQGRIYELLVGSYLVNHGLDVDMAKASDEEEKKERQQAPDILVNGSFGIEVKSYKRELPVNPDSLIPVDSVNSWKRKKKKPFAYVQVSKTTWEMLWIDGRSTDGWIIKPAYGKLYYHAPRSLFDPVCMLTGTLRTLVYEQTTTKL